jgi:hypothetical protein
MMLRVEELTGFTKPPEALQKHSLTESEERKPAARSPTRSLEFVAVA